MSDPRLVSLSHRLRNIAAQEGVPPQRVRNRYVFQRVLARLARDPRWVLKGGFGLELRLGLAARTTKDLDLLLTEVAGLTAADLQDLLDEALDVDLGDDCTFGVRPHAYARIYAHERPSSRVKDLVDLALLVEQDLLEPGAFARAVAAVFAERDAADPPLDLPEPPRDWRVPFAAMASEIGLSERTLNAAAALVRRFYLSAFDDEEPQ